MYFEVSWDAAPSALGYAYGEKYPQTYIPIFTQSYMFLESSPYTRC